jgi:hypothetical protein
VTKKQKLPKLLLKYVISKISTRAGADFVDKELQVAKQKEENVLLQKAMQTAARDASRELQSKDKRMHQLEKKVSSQISRLQ